MRPRQQDQARRDAAQVSRATMQTFKGGAFPALLITFIPFNGGWTPWLPSLTETGYIWLPSFAGWLPLAAMLDREWLPLAATPLIAGWLPSMDLSIGSIGPHQWISAMYLSNGSQYWIHWTSPMYLSNGSGGQPRHRAPRGTHRTQIRQACPCRAPSRRISHQKVEAEANRARRPSAQIVVHAAPEAHLHDEGVWRGGRRRPPSERVEWVRRCAERARICVCG